MPKVSILIPVYNRKSFIADCVQSALDQTFTDFEIVVVDNASDDGTWEICQQFAAKDRRVRAFQNDTNIGPVRNWLACVEKARGEYGKILFSDDLMFPLFLEHTLPFFENPEVGFVSTAVLFGATVETGVIDCGYLENAPFFSVAQYYELLLNAHVPYSPGSAIFRMTDIRLNLHSSFLTCVPRDFTINGAGPDVMLYALTALKYKTVVMITDVDVFFRVHPDSYTVANTNGNVTNGYWAVLAWFFNEKVSRFFWAKFIARTWITKIKNTKKLSSLVQHSLDHEGKGGFSEVLMIMIAMVYVLLFRAGVITNNINKT